MHVQTVHQYTHKTEISESSWEDFLSAIHRDYEASTGHLVMPVIRRMEDESALDRLQGLDFLGFSSMWICLLFKPQIILLIVKWRQELKYFISVL